MNNIDILIEYISPSEKKQNCHVFKKKMSMETQFSSDRSSRSNYS